MITTAQMISGKIGTVPETKTTKLIKYHLILLLSTDKQNDRTRTEKNG